MKISGTRNKCKFCRYKPNCNFYKDSIKRGIDGDEMFCTKWQDVIEIVNGIPDKIKVGDILYIRPTKSHEKESERGYLYCGVVDRKRLLHLVEKHTDKYIKQNILVGDDFVEKKYLRCIEHSGRVELARRIKEDYYADWEGLPFC